MDIAKGSIKLQVIADGIEPDLLQILDTLSSEIYDACLGFTKSLDQEARAHAIATATHYLLTVKWLPLLVTCDLTNNPVSYKYGGCKIYRTLTMDIMFSYKCVVSIVYTMPRLSLHEMHKHNEYI